MPTLHFKGKTFVQNHDLAVKYHQLVPKAALRLTDPAYGGQGFAPAKYVDDHTLLDYRIDFCQLPYEIYRIQR